MSDFTPSVSTGNITQWNGTAIDTNSGVKSAGTLRVLLATDQPQLTNTLKVDLSGTAANTTALKVDNSGVTQPVSAASLPLPTGASTAAKQPAIGTAGTAATDVMTVQGISSMTPLKVDGSAVTQPVSGTFYQATQPVSVASLPLPSGAATSAKQPALGTAGTASTDVLTVQGIASMTALKVDASATTQPVSGTVTANAGTNLNTSALALDATLTSGSQKLQGNVASAATDSGNPLKTGAVYNSTAPTVTTGQRVDSQADANGRHIVTLGTLLAGEDLTNNWQRVNNANAAKIALRASAAATATGNDTTTAVGNYNTAIFTLNCTAASGTTPTLNVKIQASDDGGTTWYDLVYPGTTTVVAFTQLTTTGSQLLSCSGPFGDTVRAVHTIAGTTPSFTFAVNGVFK